MAAEQAWTQLPDSPYRLWSRCDSTRTFLAVEAHEATDPLAAVCAEARDLARPSLPPLVRVERSGVGKTHLSLSTTLPAATRRRYLRAFDSALRDAARPGAPGEDTWVRSQPGAARIETAFTAPFPADATDCGRRHAWLTAIDPARALPVALDRLRATVDRCGAALGASVLDTGVPTDTVAGLVRVAVPKAPDLAAAITALAAYPEPVRATLAPDVTGWQAALVAQEAAVAAARAATIAALSPEAHACYDLVQRASGPGGILLADAARAPAGATGRAALWPVPHALVHPTSLPNRLQIEDGHGGTAWMLDMAGAMPGGVLPRAAGTVDTVTVVGPDGVARPVPLLRVACWPEASLPATLLSSRPLASPVK